VFIEPVLDAVRREPDENYFVTDMRFADEAVALRGHGFVLVNIDRPHMPDRTAAWRQHPSEHGLDGYGRFDFELKNCGHIDHYYGQLDALWQEIEQGNHLLHNFRTVQIA
jgi:hypothetical protein